jgi:hypothetical protein
MMRRLYPGLLPGMQGNITDTERRVYACYGFGTPTHGHCGRDLSEDNRQISAPAVDSMGIPACWSRVPDIAWPGVSNST